MSSPRVFGLPHLSEDAVAAFADGVLSAAAASRARRHCAECAECADAVRGQRETAMMLRAAQAPALPSGLLDRLSGVPMSATLPPPCRGLPTVLGADGTAMFVAHDVHKASEEQSGEQHVDGRAQSQAVQGHAAQSQPAQSQPAQGRQAHRRAVLPVTMLASAAAVIAAGTFGGHVSTLAAAADQQASSGAASAAGLLSGSQLPAVRSASPLAGTGSLLPVSRSSAVAASTVPAQAGRPVQASNGRLSVTLAPLWWATQQPGTAAVAGSAQARYGTGSSAARAAMMAGEPTATPLRSAVHGSPPAAEHAPEDPAPSRCHPGLGPLHGARADSTDLTSRCAQVTGISARRTEGT
jgi:hypothetical protein